MRGFFSVLREDFTRGAKKMQIYLKGKQQIYEEIAAEYRRFIEFGVYKSGDKLPSCRALAVELGINPNTVERAYSVLEEEGLVSILPKKGAYVNECEKKNMAKEAERQIRIFKENGIKRVTLIKIIDEIYKGAEND